MPGIGDLLVGGIYPVVSTALEATHQLASKNGSITAITIHNYNATARMLLLLDQVASPVLYSAQPVTPIWAYPIGGLSTTPGTLSVDWTVAPLQFKNGLWVVLSTIVSTPFSCTTTTSADGFYSALVNLA